MSSKKYFILSIILVFSVLSTYGAYLKNVPQKLTQPDGTALHCFATGDEFHNWLHDSAGYTIIQDPQTGYYVYAIESEGELLPSSYVVGKSNPQALNLKQYSNISLDKILEKRKLYESMSPISPAHKAGNKNHGHLNNLVFFLRFADEDSYLINNFTEMVARHNDSSSMEASNSMYNYYKLSSYGQFTVTTTFYPSSSNDIIYSFKDVYPRNYYREYNITTNPNGYASSIERVHRESELLKRAIVFFTDSVPSSLNLDFNNDGKVDNICFITSGYPDGWSSLLWPHRTTLYGEPIYIHGKQVSDYNLIMEGHASIGTLTHEFMHTLGAPDLYRYDYSGTPVGVWDLMASTTDNVPQGMGAHIKYKYGNWIESIPEITSSGTYTLYPVNGKSADKIAYIFYPDPLSYTYLLFEYRKTNSIIFEGSLPNSGLLIYRINNDFDGNGYYDGVDIFDEVYIYRPNGSATSNGSLRNAVFASDHSRTEFNLFTNPYPYAHNGTLIPGISITNISELGDSIQFTIEDVVETLDVSTDEISLNCASNSMDSITLNSNTAWSISGEYQWLQLAQNNGKGDQIIKFSAISANESSIARVCTLTVRTLSYNIYKRIAIKQQPCGVGIEDADDVRAISIYPNPANDYVYMDYQKPDDIKNISIYSVAGQKITSGFNAKNNKIEIPISNLSTGIYYLKIDTEKQSVFRIFSVK